MSSPVLTIFEWPTTFRRKAQAIKWAKETGVMTCSPHFLERGKEHVVQIATHKPETVGRWLSRQTPAAKWTRIDPAEDFLGDA